MKIKKKVSKKIAKQLENFIYVIDEYFRIENIDKDEYEDILDRIDKIIKKLKKGETKGIIDKKNFRRVFFRDKAFREEYQDGVEIDEDDEDEALLDDMYEDD